MSVNHPYLPPYLTSKRETVDGGLPLLLMDGGELPPNSSAGPRFAGKLS